MLLSLARSQSISRTAVGLHTTQPALSKWLRDLELDVGAVLFERHSRGLRPTAEGEAMIAHARRIMTHLRAARDDMIARRGAGEGRIAIGTSGASASSTAPLAALRLLERHPTTALELVESPMARLLERLGNGEIDVAIGRPTRHQDYPPLRCEILYHDSFVFVARRDHPLVGVEELAWDDLGRYRWIVWPQGTATRAALDEALAKEGRSVPPTSIHSDAAMVNLGLIVNSDLICIASARDAHRYSSWNIASLVPIELKDVVDVAMYWRDDDDVRLLLKDALESIRHVAIA